MAERLPPICETWRNEAQRRGNRSVDKVTKTGDGRGGILFQAPPGWTDGSSKIKYVPSGLHKGRVRFDSRHEAIDLAKRMEDQSGIRVRYDP